MKYTFSLLFLLLASCSTTSAPPIPKSTDASCSEKLAALNAKVAELTVKDNAARDAAYADPTSKTKRDAADLAASETAAATADADEAAVNVQLHNCKQ